MKALVISDTHVRKEEDINTLIEIIKPFMGEVDIIIHAGDSVSRSLVDLLDRLKPTYIVSGNMDYVDTASILPEKMVFDLGRFRIGLTHGWGHAPGLKERVFDLFKQDDVDAIIFGHSHQPYLGQRNGVLLLNPGSPTDTRFANRNTIAILYADDELKAEIVDV